MAPWRRGLCATGRARTRGRGREPGGDDGVFGCIVSRSTTNSSPRWICFCFPCYTHGCCLLCSHPCDWMEVPCLAAGCEHRQRPWISFANAFLAGYARPIFFGGGGKGGGGETRRLAGGTTAYLLVGRGGASYEKCRFLVRLQTLRGWNVESFPCELRRATTFSMAKLGEAVASGRALN